MILLLILSNDAEPQSLIQALRLRVVFLNGNAEGYLLQFSLALQLLNQCAPNVLVLIGGQKLYTSQCYAHLRPHHA